MSNNLPKMEYPQVPGITPTVIAEEGDGRAMSTPIWTNYDRLISKTPEELAKYYAKRIARCYGCEAMTEDDCFECQLDYLKNPVEEEEVNNR